MTHHPGDVLMEKGLGTSYFPFTYRAVGGIGHTYWQARPLASSRCFQGSGAAVVGLAGQVSPLRLARGLLH